MTQRVGFVNLKLREEDDAPLTVRTRIETSNHPSLATARACEYPQSGDRGIPARRFDPGDLIDLTR
jgi:hypothetical protein